MSKLQQGKERGQMSDRTLSYKERLAVVWVFWWRCSIVAAGAHFFAQSIIKGLGIQNPMFMWSIFGVIWIIGLLVILPQIVGEMIRKHYSGFRLKIQGRKDEDDTLNYSERLTLEGLMIWRAFINGLVTLSPFILMWAFVAHSLSIPHTTMRISAAVFVYVAVIFFVHPLVVREMMRMTYTGFRLAVERATRPIPDSD